MVPILTTTASAISTKVSLSEISAVINGEPPAKLIASATLCGVTKFAKFKISGCFS